MDYCEEETSKEPKVVIFQLASQIRMCIKIKHLISGASFEEFS